LNFFRRPLSTVSKETSDTCSSIDEFSDDELNNEGKYEHRQTLTEPSLLLSANTNS
jgi:hypothetical protein